MTYIEIIETIQAYIRRKNNDTKERAAFDYKLADIIRSNIAALINSQNKIPQIWDCYKGMFDDEKKEYEAKKEHEQYQYAQDYWKVIKNRISVYGELKKDREVQQ